MDFIDWSSVSWIDVSIYAALAFVAALIANLLNKALGDNFLVAAILTAILFGAAFIGMHYYPHGIDLGQSKLVRIPAGG